MVQGRKQTKQHTPTGKEGEGPEDRTEKKKSVEEKRASWGGAREEGGKSYQQQSSTGDGFLATKVKVASITSNVGTQKPGVGRVVGTATGKRRNWKEKNRWEKRTGD